jgi:predicted ATPase
LGELARSKPLVVLFEDLHNADRASLLLLEFLRQRIWGTSLLVVATRRTVGTNGDDGSPFDEAGAHVRTLALSGLSEVESSAN